MRSAVRVATLEEVCHYGRGLPRGLLPPIAGAAGAAVDHALGAAVGGFTPESITVSNNVATNDLLVAYAGVSGFFAAVPTLSDSGSNTYSASVSVISGNTEYASLLAASNPSASLTGGTSTISAAASSPLALGVGAASFTGCTSTAAAHSYASNTFTGSTSTPSVATSASVNAGDLVVATLFITSASATVTQPGTWSALSTATDAFAATIAAAWFVPASSGTVTYSPTISASSATNLLIAAFPALPFASRPRPAMQAVQRAAVR